MKSEMIQVKILYIDTRLNGHHLSYLNSLIAGCCHNHEVGIIIPRTECDLGALPEVADVMRIDWRRGIVGYIAWMVKIWKHIKMQKPDIVHFLYGDDLTRYFAIGLSTLARRAKLVVTQHQIRRSLLRDASIRRIATKSDCFVVHTEKALDDIRRLCCANTRCIEYPYFNTLPVLSQIKARERLGLVDVETPVLLALGGTRYDKGLDVLLDALSKIEMPYHLLIAGKEEFFTSDYIREKTRTFANRVTLRLEFLDDEIFSACIAASDFVTLPYRKSFDGASGPLGEAIRMKKCIIGPNHGSLSDIIAKNHLGFVFESENPIALGHVITEALMSRWEPDDTYDVYRMHMDPARFQGEYKALYYDLLQGEGKL